MPKLIFLKGLPASGKSTWAREQVDKGNGSVIRFNKDDMRAMIHNNKHSKGREAEILDLQWNMVQRSLIGGRDVIVDNTHFNPIHLKQAQSIIDELNRLFPNKQFKLEEIFFDTPLEECIRRDATRPNSVGRKVIMQMYNKYLKPSPPPVIAGLPHAIIVDLDGTLANFGDKNPYVRDFENDLVNKQVLHLVRSVKSSEELEYWKRVIILSGRSAQFEKVTIDWLQKNYVPYDLLVMRQVNDGRPDYIVKKWMYDTYVKDKFNIDFVIDDRPQVVRLWRSLGLYVFDVNQSGVEF